jgi:DNA-binding PucR family transcriptional regulator
VSEPIVNTTTDPVTAHVIEVGAVLNSRLSDIVAQMRSGLVERITELGGDTALIGLLGASVEGNVDNIVHALQHGIRGEQLEPPSAAYEYARRLAQRGVPISALIRAYRLGQQYVLRQAFDVSFRTETSADIRARAYDRMVTEVSDYIDWISQGVVVVYEEERESWLASQANSRNAKVRELLASPENDVDAAEATLGYRLRGHHIAVVVWVDQRRTNQDQLSGFTKATRALAERLQSTGPPLLVGVDGATAWGWIPVPRSYCFDPAVTEWNTEPKQEMPVPRFALSASGAGLDGFRNAHHQALQVQRLALQAQRPTRAVLSYEEPGLALAALLSQQLDATRAWPGTVLGDLVTDDELHQRHRETLLAFLRHEGSYTATAEAMVMHKNSIKYRIAAAQKILGRALLEDRLSIEAALTVCHWLGSAVLRRVSS